MGLKHLAGNSKLKVTARNVASSSSFRVVLNNISTGKVSAKLHKSRGNTLLVTMPFDTRGVVRVTVEDNEGQPVKSYVTVGTAEIDCCIAKLVHDAINCTCKCNKCKEDLNRAQTVRLLLQAAKYEATLGLEESVQEKYNKAKELCVEVCACGC